jgi:hypothetical protein
LRPFLGEDAQVLLRPDSTDEPESWEPRDAGRFSAILGRVRERLAAENGRLPLLQFLWWVDGEGERWGGSTQITLPFDGIELVHPHPPVVKLDGGHGDVSHRGELRVDRVRVDPILLEKFEADWRGQISPPGLGDDPEGPVLMLPGYPNQAAYPVVSEHEGWLRAEPVMTVLGQRIEVETLDALGRFGPDLNLAIEVCDRARDAGRPLFWLAG